MNMSLAVSSTYHTKELSLEPGSLYYALLSVTQLLSFHPSQYVP